MRTQQLKAMVLTSFLSLTGLTAQAAIINDITDGCTANGPIVSAMCVTLSPIYTIIITSVVPTELSGNSKIIYQAQSDAALFVATHGAVKGVYLENAFILLRQNQLPLQQTDDLTLAKAILAYEEN